MLILRNLVDKNINASVDMAVRYVKIDEIHLQSRWFLKVGDITLQGVLELNQEGASSHDVTKGAHILFVRYKL